MFPRLIHDSRVFRQNFAENRGERDERIDIHRCSLKGRKCLYFILSVSSLDFYLFMMHGWVKIEYLQSLRWFHHCYSITDDFSSRQTDDVFFIIEWFLSLCLFLCGNGQSKSKMHMEHFSIFFFLPSHFDSLGHQTSLFCISDINMHIYSAWWKTSRENTVTKPFPLSFSVI